MGVFVAFEGPEGAGKSTQLRRLAEALKAQGLEPLVTKEPGGTPVGEHVRRVVLLEPDLDINPMTEFLLYSASRAQLVADVLRPALTAGRTVLCDRYTGASVAYQGYGRGLPLGFVRSLSAEVTGGLTPDLTLLFDLEPEVGLARVARRGEKDRLEGADLAFHQRVRAGFLAQAEEDSSWKIIDASLGEEAVERLVREAVQAYVPGLTRSV